MSEAANTPKAPRKAKAGTASLGTTPATAAANKRETKHAVGVVIVALGLRMYVEMAINLALTIKAYQGLPITLLLTDEHRDEQNGIVNSSGLKVLEMKKAAFLFDYVHVVPLAGLVPGRYGQPAYQAGKLLAHRYSEYELTIQVDADSIAFKRHGTWLNWANQCGDGLAGITFGEADFTAPEVPALGYTWWTTRYAEVAAAAGLKPGDICTQYNSSIMAYRNGTPGEAALEKAYELYMSIDPVYFQPWGGYLADECVLDVASGLVGSRTPQLPSPMFNYGRKIEPHHIGATFWGNKLKNLSLISMANNHAIEASRKLKVDGIYTLYQKLQKSQHDRRRIVY